jgi:very-short-patch-repair endonuclease
MASRSKTKGIATQIVIAVLLATGGIYYHPMLFLAAAAVAWSAIKELQEPPAPEVDAWFTRRYTTTAADPDWKSYFLPLCESPAESAFLEAMIQAHHLEPDNGVLKGNGLTLELQVQMPPYRADFAVNEWLVVEIDGAAYHSSSEAVERDGIRDEVMRGWGLTVLRIPAKVVFATPLEAVARVSTAVVAGKAATTAPKPAALTKRSIFAAIGNGLSTVSNTVDEFNKSVELSRAVNDANATFLEAFHIEKSIISKSMEQVRATLAAEKWMAQSPKHREHYLASFARIQALLPETEDPFTQLKVPVVPPMGVYADPNIAQSVINARRYHEEERSRFFTQAREDLIADALLREGVRHHLVKTGHATLWSYIA